MRIVYLLKRWSIITLVSLLIVGLVAPAPSLSRTEARYELCTGGITFGNDLGQVNSRQALFHQQTLSSIDNEAFAIDFPPFTSDISGITLGPASAGSSFDILPFGLVNLAFPSLSETSDQSYSASSTGFYQASFLGIPPVNYGGSQVLSGAYAPTSPVRPPSSILGSNMMIPEMNNTIPGIDRSQAIAQQSKASNNSSTNKTVSSKPNNTTQSNQTSFNAALDINGSASGQGIAGGDTTIPLNNIAQNETNEDQTQGNPEAREDETISGQEIAGAETAIPVNATTQNVPQNALTYADFNFKSKSGRISNMSLLDRMWRNSHLGSMGRAYEGDTAYPEWILPTGYTKSAIALANWTDVNNIALNQTVPGTHLMPRFWSLGITSLNNSSKYVGDKNFYNSTKKG